jgi:hypothetical protein
MANTLIVIVLPVNGNVTEFPFEVGREKSQTSVVDEEICWSNYSFVKGIGY